MYLLTGVSSVIKKSKSDGEKSFLIFVKRTDCTINTISVVQN